MNVARDHSNLNHAVSGGGRIQLWALFGLIIYTPLPLASNRPWALALLGLLTGGLLLWNIWRSSGHSMVLAWKRTRVPLILLGLWVALLTIQIIPLPASWVDVLGQRALTGFGDRSIGLATISIDPYFTQLYLAKALILTAVFWLVVVLVDSRRRIELLAKVIVFSGLLQAMIGVLWTASGMTLQIFFVAMNTRAHGTFVYHNHFAGYLELTLAVGIGLMIAKLDGSKADNWRQRMHGWLALLVSEKALLRISLIIMVVGLVASRSRMGNSAFFISLLIIGMFTVLFAKHVTYTEHDKLGKRYAACNHCFYHKLDCA